MSRRFPRTPSFYVTHHVNPDVPRATPPTDRLRTVYFGLRDNTVLPGTLAGAVDLVSATGAAFTAEHWRATAPNYNCHWIVRRISRWEWHKPFLKGFVAARCGSAVIVTRDDMNAAYYLGDDYPFYAETDALPDLEMAWARAASGFGGPSGRWRSTSWPGWTRAAATSRSAPSSASCSTSCCARDDGAVGGPVPRRGTLMQVEAVVVGAGVVGLAVARSLAMAGREVVVLEAEGLIGSHTSSRNSEVIHAGIYYPPGSAKARLCVRGKRLLYDYCARRAVPHRRLGKIIVATDPAQVADLERIDAAARANGVCDLLPLDAGALAAREPRLRGVAGLLSPTHRHRRQSRADAEPAG